MAAGQTVNPALRVGGPQAQRGGGGTVGEAQKGASSEEINRLIVKHAKPGVKFTLEDVRGHRAVGVGLASRVGVVVDGEAGDFLAAFNAGALVVAKASVGNYVGYGMTAGLVQVVGSAGEGAGALLQGGAVHVFADAGAGAGWQMAGGEVVVKDDAGELAGAGMVGGELAVLGRAQGVLGVSMGGGAIFARAGSAFDPLACRTSPLDMKSALRFKALAAAVKVSDLDPLQFVRAVASAPARAPSAPPPVSPLESAGGPRVRVSVEGDAPREVDPR
jgi:methylamine---glutamate N-methyltransferase subunit B